MAPTASELRRLFTYWPDTGELIWRISPSDSLKKGTLAGTLRPDKRWGPRRRVNIGGRGYYVYRIIWCMVTGEWPTGVIDHKDRNPLNNRWENLRQATLSQNGANARLSKFNKLGVKGVSRTPYGRYSAQIKCAGTRYYLGSFATVVEAQDAYRRKALELYGEFASPLL